MGMKINAQLVSNALDLENYLDDTLQKIGLDQTSIAIDATN